MNNSKITLPNAYNEPVKQYLPRTRERKMLEKELNRQLQTFVDVPLVINGEKIQTHDRQKVVCPHDHAHVLGAYCNAGAIFASDRHAVNKMMAALSHSAGNFYINDKPTGAVVGHQPFGGGRGSGTNDKAGSLFNLLRWTSARTIKENFVPPEDYTYPFMAE